MPAGLVFAVFGCAIALAVLLLHFFRATHWYWHALSVIVAFTMGLVRLPPAWQSPAAELAMGGAFVFLFLWGICAPIFPKHHGPTHHQPHHA